MAKALYKGTRYPTENVAAAIVRRYRELCTMRGRDTEDIEKVKAVCEKAARWMTDPKTGDWLIIIGNVGTGKTTLMQAIRWAQGPMTGMNGKALRGLSISALDLPRLAGLEENDPQWQTLAAGTDDYPVLYVDDLGQEPTEVKSYGNSLSPVVEIITKRYANQRPLVITSNLTAQELAERYGERVADRIKEMAEIIIIKGKSYRR